MDRAPGLSVHNAIVHNLPEQGTVSITTRAHLQTVALTVENSGETRTPQLVATLDERFQRGHLTRVAEPDRIVPEIRRDQRRRHVGCIHHRFFANEAGGVFWRELDTPDKF